MNRACLGSLLTCIEIPTVPLTCFGTLNKAAPLGASVSLSVNSGDWRWFLSPFQHQHFLNPDQRFPVDVLYLVCKGLSNFTVSCQCLASLISPRSLDFRYLLRLFGRSGHRDAPCPVAVTRNSRAAAAHVTKMLCSAEICHGTACFPPVHLLQPLWAFEFTTHNLGFLKFRFLHSACALTVPYDQINPLGSHALPTSLLKIPCIHQYISGSEKSWGPQISEESIARTQKKDFFQGQEQHNPIS